MVSSRAGGLPRQDITGIRRLRKAAPRKRFMKCERPNGPAMGRAVEKLAMQRALFGVVGLRLLLGRRQPFQALEQFFLAHVLGHHLGVVGIDRSAAAGDQRHIVGLRARRPRRTSAANGSGLPSDPPARRSFRRSRAATRPGSCRCRGRCVICEPDEIMRARWLASSTRSKRFSTLSMQSSTVTRAMGSVLLQRGVVLKCWRVGSLLRPKAQVRMPRSLLPLCRSALLGNAGTDWHAGIVIFQGRLSKSG